MSTLLFCTILWAAGFAAWVTDRKWPWTDKAAAFPAAIVAGLTAAVFLAAWTPAQASVVDTAVVKATIVGNWTRLPADQQATVCRRWTANPDGRFVKRTARLARNIADGISRREARRGVTLALSEVCR